jgi:signal transduction histidine kinase
MNTISRPLEFNGLRSGNQPDTWQSAVLEERNRLAGEIHDTLAQNFAGILLHLEAARAASNTRRHELTERLARARQLAKCGLEDTRRMLLGLRPKPLDGPHFVGALHKLAKGVSPDCGIDCKFSISGPPRDLPQIVQDELYRVAQEALSNVRKHSRATRVWISLNYTSQSVRLAIRDNGQGFSATTKTAGAQGYGLPTMCDRAERIGGKLNVHSGPGTGTEVTITVPMSQEI